MGFLLFNRIWSYYDLLPSDRDVASSFLYVGFILSCALYGWQGAGLCGGRSHIHRMKLQFNLFWFHPFLVKQNWGGSVWISPPAKRTSCVLFYFIFFLYSVCFHFLFLGNFCFFWFFVFPACRFLWFGSLAVEFVIYFFCHFVICGREVQKVLFGNSNNFADPLKKKKKKLV